MAAEIKLIIEGLGNIKKKIEDGFKSGININAKQNQKSAPDFNKFVLKDLDKQLSDQFRGLPQLENYIDDLNKSMKWLVDMQQKSKENLKINQNILKYKSNLETASAHLMEKQKNILELQSQKQQQLSKIQRQNMFNEKPIERSPTAVPFGTKKGAKGGAKGGGMGGIGLAAVMGGVAGLMIQLVKSTKAISFTLEVIGGMINALIGPFLPILIGLMKPLFSVLLFLAGFMILFFKDPVAALQMLFDAIVDSIGNLLGFGGKDKQKGAVAGAGAIAGGVIGASLGGPVGAAIGATIGGSILQFLIDMFTKFLFFVSDIFGKLGEWTAIAHNKIVEMWDSAKKWFGDMWEGIKEAFSALGDKFLGIGAWFGEVWNSLKLIFSDSWDSLKSVFSDSWSVVTEWLSTLWEDLKSVFSDAWELLKGFGIWLYDSLKSILTTSLGALSGIGEWINSRIKDMWNSAKSTASDIIDKAKSFVSGTPTTSMEDGIITPTGQIVKTAPNDYIMAMKRPQDLGKGSGNNITINLTVNGNADRGMIDTIVKQLRKELTSRGSY